MQTATHEAVPHRHIDVKEVAKLYGCSWRTAYRYADAGKIPFGVRLGALRRWDAAEIHEHIKAGCPPLRKGSRK